MLVVHRAFLAGDVLFIILPPGCGLELPVTLNEPTAEYCLLQIETEWLFL